MVLEFYRPDVGAVQMRHPSLYVNAAEIKLFGISIANAEERNNEDY